MADAGSVLIVDYDDVLVAGLEGVVDLVTGDQLFADIVAAVEGDRIGLVVNLSAVRFLDSAGIGHLFDLTRRLRRRRQAMHVVIAAGHPVREVVELVGLSETAPLHETLPEALDAMRKRHSGES